MKLNRSEISKIVSGRIFQSEQMSRHTTFNIGGPCDFYIEVRTIEELKRLIRLINKNKSQFLIIGFGSNILVKDKGIRGVVIRLVGDFCGLDFNLNKRSVIAGGGCAVQFFVKKCADNGFSGMEFLVGIPGTVGGAIKMNAGTKDGDIGSLVKSVTVMNEKGIVKKISRRSLKFSYRNSNISNKDIIVSADLSLKKKDKNDITKNLNKLMLRRAKTQPLGFHNAGCIFKNPDGEYASRLIDEAGLKGTSIGGAMISKLHANYINNTGNATADEVLNLIKKIQKKVKEKFNKKLELEIKVVGE